MKITQLLNEMETPSSSTSIATNSAPNFGRSDQFLEDEKVEESSSGGTSAGSVASVSAPTGGAKRRGQGSMFAGIKTSAKFPNSEAVKEGLPKQPKDEFKRQALLVKDRKTGKLYDPNVEFDKKMNSPEVKAQMKRMATKESQINEVDPRNFDSDEDYYAARNAPAKPRSQARQSPGVNQDDEAYFREIFRKKRLAAQQAERSADHDRLATGTNEGEEMGTFAALKDWQVWDVTVMNNYYRGKYADYGARYYSVVAGSPEEAREVVLNNADYVLRDLLSRKLQSGKKVLPRGSALPVEEKRVGDAKPGSITTMGFKKMLTPDGVQSFKFSNGKIVDGSHTAGGEQVNEKSKSQAQFRTMAAVANNPEFAKKVGISQSVGKEFRSADRKQDYKELPKEVDEASFDYTMKDLGNDYAGFPSNHSIKHKFLAKIKPEKQQLYKDKMNNMQEFDQLFQLFTVAKQRGDIIEQGVAEGLPKAQDGRYNPDGSKKQAWHKDPRWQQHAKDWEKDPKNIYSGVGKKKVKEQGVAEGSEPEYMTDKNGKTVPVKPKKDGYQIRAEKKKDTQNKAQGVAEGEPRKTMGLDASLDQHFNDKKHLLNPGVAHRGQLVTIIKAPRMVDLLPGETFEVSSSDADGVTLKHGLGTKFDNVKFPHGTYKISKAQGVAENFDAQAAASKEAEIGRLKAQLKNPNNSFDDHYKITRQIQKLIGMHTDDSVLGKDVAEESTAPTKYRATVEYGPTAADAHFVTVTANSTEEAEAKVQKWCEKKGVRNPMITINGADKPVDVAEGGYPDVDHMPGLVNKYNRTPAKPTSNNKFYTDKKQWLRDVDDINHSKYDDNSEYIGQTGRSSVEINGVPWAVWSDAKQKGYIAMGTMSEEKQRLDPKCWSGYKKQGTKMKGGTRVNNCVKVDEAEFTEDKLANDLYRDLQIFKKGAAKDIGSKAKDKEIGNKPKDKDIVAKEGFGDTIKKKAKQFSRYMTEPQSPHNDQVRSRAKNIDKIRKQEEKKSVFEKDPEAMREFERSGGYEAGIDVMGWQVGWAAAKHARGDTMKQAFQKLYYGGGSSFPFSERAFKLAWVAYTKHHGPEAAIEEDWQKTNKSDKTDGMSPKAVKAYRRENPGSKLKTAVTKKPSELKAGSKDANRRKSFCARMSGNKGPMKDENGEPTPKAKALKRWNC